jgi:hypothetical protein
MGGTPGYAASKPDAKPSGAISSHLVHRKIPVVVESLSIL